MTSKKSSTKTLIISLLAFLILATGSNQEVQETITYYTGLEKDFTEYIQGNKKVLGANVETAKVNRVIDGDTIVLEDGRTIRLLNVDTPETKKPGVPIMCYGTESSKFLTALLEERQVQLIKDEESTDRYGRDLRFVYLDGKNIDNIFQSVNAELVKLGFAKVAIYQPNDTYETEFYELQDEARKNNLGAWSSCEKPFEN